ncbi:chromate efflux transporter [Sphingobium boeckii]|uniref:Chromate transporter n=1 Tax=Sphingobium boeckii TaxID=1082345 RepID=A0A7W9AL77_9SPHN|nr:chromate efflux transporter [Sphingobium boeckii]MBB5687583.1 chromate transporter [Sphingobium boeckii]
MAEPSFRELTTTFARIGILSFGGPAGQIALMHRELVDDKGWIEEGAYLRALNFCHLLPGPEAQQLATYIGWRLHGLKGGLTAGLLFVIPGAAIILGLSILYGYAANLAWFDALFLGIKAAVLAIVVQALIRIGRRALNSPFKRILAFAAFLALFLFNLPFPLVVLGSGAIGMVVAAVRPDWLKLAPPKPVDAPPTPRRAIIGHTIRAIIAWGLIWAAPMALVLLMLGQEHILWKIGVFFSQLAVVTFGGAYAVLAYMAQEAVQSHHWLNAGEMADGLGLAETTPGPLIMVTQFVGYLAAFRAPEPFSPLMAGILGAGLTTWVTFAPCFLWIFAFAPWIERLEHARKLQGGLAALTAAVVGVIANLTVWFALHILFTRVAEAHAGPVRFYVPDGESFAWTTALLAILAAILLFALNRGVMVTLAICAAGGLLLGAL